MTLNIKEDEKYLARKTESKSLITVNCIIYVFFFFLWLQSFGFSVFSFIFTVY